MLNLCCIIDDYGRSKIQLITMTQHNNVILTITKKKKNVLKIKNTMIDLKSQSLKKECPDILVTCAWSEWCLRRKSNFY